MKIFYPISLILVLIPPILSIRIQRQATNSVVNVTTVPSRDTIPLLSENTEEYNFTRSKNTKSSDFQIDAKGKVVIQIGHIGAIGAMPNAEKVINISRLQLFDEGILGDDLDVM
jgi:hypothetical protein